MPKGGRGGRHCMCTSGGTSLVMECVVEHLEPGVAHQETEKVGESSVLTGDNHSLGFFNLERIDTCDNPIRVECWSPKDWERGNTVYRLVDGIMFGAEMLGR